MTAAIETFSGLHFEPLKPEITAVRIEDVAHALANQCRFSGHCRFRYSVAEHSVRVSELLEEWRHGYVIQLWGLLHDASEAYLVDLPSPLKATKILGDPYRAAEAILQKVICRRVSLPTVEPAPVRRADRVLLVTEARDLMPGIGSYWKKIRSKPLPGRIRPWGEGVAEAEFLRRYRELTKDQRRLKAA
jgi:hypothetical protein